MVEHGRTERRCWALAFDGLGYGPDGTLWGGELLVADLSGYERVGHLATVPMPGGVAAIREPWRMAAVWLAATAGRSAVAGALPASTRTSREAVLDLAESELSPQTTSMGRLFDAVAVLLGGRRRGQLRGAGRHRAGGAGPYRRSVDRAGAREPISS